MYSGTSMKNKDILIATTNSLLEPVYNAVLQVTKNMLT